MAIIPIAERYNPEEDEMEFVLSNDDFEKCRLGYGCSNCLCDFNGLFLTTCPDCGAEVMVNPRKIQKLQRGDESFHFPGRRR